MPDEARVVALRKALADFVDHYHQDDTTDSENDEGEEIGTKDSWSDEEASVHSSDLDFIVDDNAEDSDYNNEEDEEEEEEEEWKSGDETPEETDDDDDDDEQSQNL